jgi:PAS domain S-box-containing protein
MSMPLDHLERLLDSADVGVWRLHVPSGSLTRNDVFLRLVQASAEDFRDGVNSWVNRIHPSDRKEVLEKHRRMMAGELSAYWVDYRVRCTTGGWAPLRARVVMMDVDAEGHPLSVCGLLTEISRERALERRMRAVFDRPFQFIGLLGLDGVVLETNRRAAGAGGTDSQDVLGIPFWEGPLFAHSPALQQQLREGVARAAQGELVRFEMFLPGGAKPDHTIDFTLTPLRDDDGSITHIIKEGRDISDVAKTREELRAAEQRLITATEAAGHGLWEWTIQTNQMWFSDNWYRILGLQPRAIPSNPNAWRDLVHPDDRPRVKFEPDEHIGGDQINKRVEMRMRRADGSWGWFLSSARTVDRDASGNAKRIAGILVDISERKEADRRTAAAERLESIGRMAAGLAHEINTPVQYANDSVYFIRDAIQELSGHIATQNEFASAKVLSAATLSELQQELPNALDRISTGLTRIAEIARSLREFTHSDYEIMVPVDLTRVIQNTLVVATSEVKYVADVKTRFADLPLVSCYAGQISQVILTLVINAAHAIAQVTKGSSDRGLISITTAQDSACAVISVSDTGGGIPVSIRDRLFEPFVTTKEVGRGIGQGLSMARKVVVQGHGGSISFQSESGQGTTFIVRLPLDSTAALEYSDST